MTEPAAAHLRTGAVAGLTTAALLVLAFVVTVLVQAQGGGGPRDPAAQATFIAENQLLVASKALLIVAASMGLVLLLLALHGPLEGSLVARWGLVLGAVGAIFVGLAHAQAFANQAEIARVVAGGGSFPQGLPKVGLGTGVYAPAMFLGVGFLALGLAMRSGDAFGPLHAWGTLVVGVIFVALTLAPLENPRVIPRVVEASLLLWTGLVGWRLRGLGKDAGEASEVPPGPDAA